MNLELISKGPGNKTGATITLLIFVISALSSWATYNQFALGLTYVTLPTLICLPIFIFSFLSGMRIPRLRLADYCVLIIYLICLFSYVWTLREQAWANQIYWYSICFIVYFMVRFFIVTPSRIALIGYGALIGTVFAALLLGEQTNEWGVVSKRQSIKGLNNNFIAYVIVGSFYLYLLINKLKFFPKWMGYLVIPLASFVFVKLLLLGTRGALVGFVALCVWLFIYKIFSRNVIVVSIVIGFLGIMLFTSGYFESSISHLGSYSERDTGDLSGRVPTWAVARGYIYDYYLLGIGIGSFSLVNPNGMGAHNFFLTILLETGFIGFGAFLCFFVSLFLPALVKKPTENNKFVLGAFFVFWFPIAMTGHWELSPFSWLLLGVTFNILRYQQRNYA